MNTQLKLVTDNTGKEQATKILAKSLYRELKKSDYSDSEIAEFAVALVENVVTNTTIRYTNSTIKAKAKTI